MTTFRTFSSGPCCSGTLQNSVQTYLQALSQANPDSTVLSHQTHLSDFLEWYRDQTIEAPTDSEELIGRFARDILVQSDIAISTARGYLCSLVNLFAYHTQRDPELLKLHLASLLYDDPDPTIRTFGEQLSPDSDGENLQSLRSDVHRLRTFLRRRRFGSRTHAYVELLSDTKSRPAQVRALDLTDLNLEAGHVRVGIPDTYAVSAVGLVTQRVADLSESTVEALRTYVEYERTEPGDSANQPVFTTSRSRASQSTLRRSVKTASETAIAPSSTPNQRISKPDVETHPANHQPAPVVPADICRYARSKILTEQ